MFFSEFDCFTVITFAITFITVSMYCMVVHLSLKPNLKAALNCHCNMSILSVYLLYLTCFFIVKFISHTIGIC